MKWLMRLWIALPLITILISGHIWWSHSAIFRPIAQVSFLNVDQGDATLIQTDTGQRVLVDCGDIDGPILTRLQEQLGFLARRIDMLIVTHGHRDHYGGCFDVLERYQVGAVMINGVRKEEGSLYEGFLAAVTEREIQILPGLAGTEIDLGQQRLEILHPTNQHWGDEISNDNEFSIVVAGFGDENTFVLMGDAYTSNEHEIMRRYPELRADILKVGHHGSDTSTSQEWLNHIQPDIAIISAGQNNRHGHPHTEVIERLHSQKIIIKETKHLTNIDILW